MLIIRQMTGKYPLIFTYKYHLNISTYLMHIAYHMTSNIPNNNGIRYKSSGIGVGEKFFKLV